MNAFDKLIEVLENEKANPIIPDDKQPDGNQMPYVVYHKAVNDFISEMYDKDLLDKGYGEKLDEKGWWNETKMRLAIPQMTKDDVLTCLTAIIRQENFCDGTIGRFAKNGILLALLKRYNAGQ